MIQEYIHEGRAGYLELLSFIPEGKRQKAAFVPSEGIPIEGWIRCGEMNQTLFEEAA